MNNNSVTTLGFTGDVSFSGFFKDGYKNEKLLSPEILEFLDGNDANIINQESPITQCRITKKRRLAHRSDVAVIPYIKKTIPNPVFSLANNHMLDFGRIGVVDSVENLEKENCTFIGAGRNLEEASKYIVVGNKVKIGVIAIQYKSFKFYNDRMAAPFYQERTARLKEQINRMKTQDKVDWVVVVYHGGEEFLNAPLPFNRKRLHSFVNMGADAVVAHHPHVVQGYEYYRNKPIFYSLGNFIFDTTYQRAQEGTTEGMLLKLSFTKDKISFENLPISIDRESSTVGVGKENPYFVNLADINYNAEWTYQCTRKKQALAKATELRVAENQAIREFEKSERDRVNEIKEKYGIEQDTPKKTSSKKRKKGAKKKAKKKGIRKLVSQLVNKKKRTYNMGTLLYKLFYRNKEIKNN